MKVVAVIPAYNEERHIKDVIEQTYKWVDELIVVNDGSKDKTLEILKSLNISNLTILNHKINLGKGGAVKTGFEAAIKHGVDIIVTMDSDGQHPPEFIPKFIDAIKNKNTDIVFSYRQGGTDHMPFIRKIGNRTLNAFCKILFNIELRDIWCGMRAIKAKHYPIVKWRKNDYSGEIEMSLKAGINKLKYTEIEIPTIYHDTAKGVTIVNGLKLLAQMFLWRLIL